jgi:hypothetical protein
LSTKLSLFGGTSGKLSKLFFTDKSQSAVIKSERNWSACTNTELTQTGIAVQA